MTKDNKKQIIVTGGAGFIGTHLVTKLIRLGYFPIVIDNFSNSITSKLKTISKNDYFLVRSDINDANKILKKIKDYTPQTIIHLAAMHYIPFCIETCTLSRFSAPCRAFHARSARWRQYRMSGF